MHAISRSRSLVATLLATALAALIAGGACSKADDVGTAPQPAATSGSVPQRTVPPVGGTTIPASPKSSKRAVAKREGKIPVFAAMGDATPSQQLDNPWLYNNEPAARITLTFLVKDDQGGQGDWLEVYLGVRPTDSTGWIKRADVNVLDNPYRLEVTLGAFNLKAYEGDKLLLDAPVAIGQPGRGTLVGTHFLTVLIKSTQPDGPYGVYAYGMSAYSEDAAVNAAFKGGQLGLHGTNDPSSIGKAVSNGCIRLTNDNIAKLAAVVPIGTPIVISE